MCFSDIPQLSRPPSFFTHTFYTHTFIVCSCDRSFKPIFWHAPAAYVPFITRRPAEQIRRCFFSPEGRQVVMRSLMAVSQTYHFKGFLVPIGVDRWQEMDSGLFHQVTYPPVARQILLTHELHQQEEQLSSQHLVTMGTRRVTKLRFTWSIGSYEGGDEGRR